MKGMNSKMKMIIRGFEVSFDEDMQKEIGGCSFQSLIKDGQVFLLPCFPNAKDSYRSEDFPMERKKFVENLRSNLGQDDADIEFTGYPRYNGILLLPEVLPERNEASEKCEDIRATRNLDLRGFHEISADKFSGKIFRVTKDDQVGNKADGDPLYCTSFEKDMTQLEAVTLLKKIVEQHPEGWFGESDLNYFVWLSDDRMYHSLNIQRLDR